MIRKFFKWYLSSSKKPIIENNNLYDKIVELENRISKLEEENIENSILFCELENSIQAVDTRIDILTIDSFKKNV